MVLCQRLYSLDRIIGDIMVQTAQNLYVIAITFTLLSCSEGYTRFHERSVLSSNPQFSAYRPPEMRYNNPQFRNSFIVSRTVSNPRRYSSLLEAERSLGQQTRHMLANNGQGLPWSCPCDRFWRDLGENFYPRFIRDGRCRSSTCYHGHYTCRPLTYSVPVLKRITPGDDVSERDRVFGNEFYFVSVTVTTACYCGPNMDT